MIKRNKLPPELISLIHHIELNKEGWWEKAIERLITATIWLSNSGYLTSREILRELREGFSIRIDEDTANRHIRILLENKTLVSVGNSRFKISEQCLREFNRSLEEAGSIEANAKESFCSCLNSVASDIDAENAWNHFNSSMLIPLVKELGARTFEIISGTKEQFEDIPRFSQFLDDYHESIREAIKETILRFMNPTNEVARSYILSQLSVFFILEAGNLSQETIDALSRAAKNKPTFRIYTDTNFLLSALGLDSPDDAGAISLVELAHGLHQLVDISWLVSKVTIEEAKLALSNSLTEMKNLKLAQPVLQAASQTNVSGLCRKYLEEAAGSNYGLSPDDYFRPFIQNMTEILRDRGFVPDVSDCSIYEEDDNVSEEISMQREFELKKYGSQAKGVGKLKHDIVLWHFVNDKREPVIEAPQDAVFWIATIDFRFLGYDSYTRREMTETIPLCIHPAALMQMLQFWVPRTPEFEDVVLGNLRLPFLVQEFDQKTEDTTLRILQVLSRFENIGDLSSDAARAIITSSALREKIQHASTDDDEIELVREALIEINKEMRTTIEEQQSAVSEYKESSEGMAEQITRLLDTVSGQTNEIEDVRTELVDSQTDLEDLRSSLTIEKEERDKKDERSESRNFKLVYCWGLGLLSIIIISSLFVLFHALKVLPWMFIVSFLILILWLVILDQKGNQIGGVEKTSWYKQLHKFRNWVFGSLLTGIIIGLIVAVIAWIFTGK